MKISEQWLREWVATRWDTHRLVERLTMAGVEVSGAIPVAAISKHVIVGEVQSVAQVTESERLTLCAVRVAKNKTIKVVCGASNIGQGMKVVVALPGARLPSGTSISSTVVGGVTSEGMICSGADLGIEDHSTGILELERSAQVGTPLYKKSSRSDVVLEFDLTPNRGDCLSVVGLAREIAAVDGTRVKEPVLKSVRVQSRRRVPVKLIAQQDCPRYVGRIVEDISPHSVTPMWLRERLYRSGIRSIHPVVDVMNHVMLELGQPMHAFDLDKLRGGIVVRHAHKNEVITLLDGKKVALEAGTLLIADDSGPVALAGIMGGAHSAVGAESKNLFLESAWFNPSAITGRGRRLGLQTESSQRFERGVDTTLQRRAIERASTLLSGIVGGRYGPIVEQIARNRIPRVRSISLRAARITRMLGLALSKNEVEGILKRLGMRTRRTAGGWSATPPPFRFDVVREIDLIEELIRIRGYHNVPERVAALPPPSRYQSETRISEPRIRQLLIDRDYQEVITYSFVAPKYQSLLDPKNEPIKLNNPISVDLAVMRTSLWPGLVQAVLYNLNRQQARLRLFEMGRRFRVNDTGMQQDKMLAGAVCGSALPVQWGVQRRDVDFYDLKADVEALLALAGQTEEIQFTSQVHPALQPGHSARIDLGSQPVGWIGSLESSIQSRLDINVPLYVFEIRLSVISNGKMAEYREISRFPSIHRDIAVILPIETPAQALWEKVRKVAGRLLVNLELFDEYRGEGIDSGRKSLALGLTLQDSSRTLKEAEADQVVAEILKVLQIDLGGQQRR